MINEESLLKNLNISLKSGDKQTAFAQAMALASLGNTYGMEQAIKLSADLKLPSPADLISTYIPLIVEAKRTSFETLERFTKEISSIWPSQTHDGKLLDKVLRQVFLDTNRSKINIFNEQGDIIFSKAEFMEIAARHDINTAEGFENYKKGLFAALKAKHIPKECLYYLNQAISAPVLKYLYEAANDEHNLSFFPVPTKPAYASVIRDDGSITGLAMSQIDRVQAPSRGKEWELPPGIKSTLVEFKINQDGTVEVIYTKIPDFRKTLAIDARTEGLPSYLRSGKSGLDPAVLDAITKVTMSPDHTKFALLPIWRRGSSSSTLAPSEDATTVISHPSSPTGPRNPLSPQEDATKDHPLIDPPDTPRGPSR